MDWLEEAGVESSGGQLVAKVSELFLRHQVDGPLLLEVRTSELTDVQSAADLCTVTSF
jgi:hypothetical protein